MCSEIRGIVCFGCDGGQHPVNKLPAQGGFVRSLNAAWSHEFLWILSFSDESIDF